MDDDTVKIAAVGDIMLGDRPLMVGFGVRSSINGSINYDPFSEVGGILKEHDIVFGNLESVISDHGIKECNYKSVQMRGPSTSIELLKRAGFNVLSIANNHIMQHGNGALFETINLIRNNGIEPLGCIDTCGRSLPSFKNIKGMNLGFIGFSVRPEKHALQTHYAQCQFNEILDSVKEHKKRCDFLVVSLHWGDEYVYKPSTEQIKQARLLADEGVSLILGHHPHVVQGIEKYKKSIIAYSMGNFVFDVWQKRLRETFILVIKINNDYLPEFERIPVFIDLKFRPKVVIGNDVEKMMNRFIKIDKMIEEQQPCTRSDCRYVVSVKINEIRNKIENRLLFLKNITRYKPWVLKQSLYGFVESRIK